MFSDVLSGAAPRPGPGVLQVVLGSGFGPGGQRWGPCWFGAVAGSWGAREGPTRWGAGLVAYLSHGPECPVVATRNIASTAVYRRTLSARHER